MRNAYMKSYWQGYRTAKRHYYDYGADAMLNEWRYGLNGQSRAYCAGWLRFANFITKKYANGNFEYCR